MVESKWPPHVPAQRGGQKKEAMKNKLQKQEEENPATQMSLAKSFEHPSLGHLNLTYANGKSYAVAAKAEAGVPKMVIQFTEAQVGENHASFLEALIYSACCKSLDRTAIKELRDTIVAQTR